MVFNDTFVIQGVHGGIRLGTGGNTLHQKPENVMALTDVKVKTAKPKEKPYKLADGGGMYLLTCEADTLGSCGYVYIAIYPTQR